MDGHDRRVGQLQPALERNGHTYQRDGSVYFKIAAFPGYGRLSHLETRTLQTGAGGRVAFLPFGGALTWSPGLELELGYDSGRVKTNNPDLRPYGEWDTTATQRFTIVITNVNDAPKFLKTTQLGPKTVNEDSSTNWMFDVYDIDGKNPRTSGRPRCGRPPPLPHPPPPSA